MMANMATSLIVVGKIKTTVARAKVYRAKSRSSLRWPSAAICMPAGR